MIATSSTPMASTCVDTSSIIDCLYSSKRLITVVMLSPDRLAARVYVSNVRSLIMLSIISSVVCLEPVRLSIFSVIERLHCLQ